MEFRKQISTVELLAPPRFGRDAQIVEHREDPLTGARSRINVARAGRKRQAQSDGADLRQVIASTEGDCCFCPQNVERKTPKFPPEICPQGRIERGESLVFPNLFPFAEYHAVGTFSNEHFLDLDEFTPEMILDNLKQNIQNAKNVLKEAILSLPEEGAESCACRRAVENCIITQSDLIPDATKDRLWPIIGKYLEGGKT